MKTLIIVPAYNEEDNIDKVMENFEHIREKSDLLVINDCSKDHTEEKLKRLGVKYISFPINLGIGGAVQAGYCYAKKNGYDIAIQVDGDGQHDMSYVPQMIEILEKEETDIVIGSRFIKKEGFQSSATRRVGINLLSFLIKLCTGKKIYDVTSGFRAVNKKFIDIYADYYPDDYPEPEAIVAAVMHRGNIQEIPVIMREREGGTSSINLRKSVYYMIKVSLAIIVCRISFGIRRAPR